MKTAVAIALAIAPQLAVAFEPALPKGARQMAAEEQPGTQYDLPTGVFRDGAIAAESIRGAVTTRSWRIDAFQGSTWELGETLGAQLVSAGYDLVFHCQTEECGGFDFRFATLVLPPPDMFVDLADFRFISARRQTPKGPEAVSVLVSRSAAAATIQVIDVRPTISTTQTAVEIPEDKANPDLSAVPDEPALPTEGISAGAIGDILADRGHVVLTGLSFETGSSRLTNGDFPALLALAEWLLEDPSRRVALVGHTDSKGALDKNIALSRARAKSVESYLVQNLEVPAKQLVAQGIGYLAPISSNATAEGRNKNRRVEAVLLSPQ